MTRFVMLLLVVLVTACSAPTPIPVATVVPYGSLPSPTPTVVPSPAEVPAASPTRAIRAPTSPPASPAITVAPSPAALATNTPAPEGQRRTISDSNLGVSFDLPSDWEPLDRAPDALPGISLRSPPVGQGPEPIIFAIDVESQPTAETSAKSVVDAQLAQVPADLASGIRRQTILVGGQPAEQVVGLPSRSGAIETFILHGGKVYVALLQPYDPENNSLSPYLGSARSAYDGMLSSWKFLQ